MLYYRVNVLSNKTHGDSQKNQQSWHDGQRWKVNKNVWRGCEVIFFRNALPNKWLWQKPRKGFEEGDSVWFCNVPVDKKLTNYCIRATCMVVLNEYGYEACHIIGLSGHKSESNIKQNWKKRDIFTVIQSAIRNLKTVLIENTSVNL